MASMDSVLGVLRSKLDELGVEIKRLTSEQLNKGADNVEELKKSRKAIEVFGVWMVMRTQSTDTYWNERRICSLKFRISKRKRPSRRKWCRK
jgi:hypothetical protein